MRKKALCTFKIIPKEARGRVVYISRKRATKYTQPIQHFIYSNCTNC